MKIKNWERFQHYKYRNPPWVRLYRDLLNDREWFALDGDTAKTLINLWLISAEDEGNLPPVEDLAFRLRIDLEILKNQINKLSHWLIDDASNMLARREQAASNLLDQSTEYRDREREREEGSTDGNILEFPIESPTLVATQYEFDGRVIRLTKKDYQSWEKAFSFLDLRSELAARDAWLSSEASPPDRKRWFISTSKYLANKSTEARLKHIKGAGRHGPDDPWAGII